MMDKTHKILALLMDANGLNQADLARATGLNQPTISRILSPDSPKGIKSPSERQTRPIANYFGITVDQLRGHQDLDIDGVVNLASSQNSGFANKEVADPIGWLQLLSEIKDPEVLGALRSVFAMFAQGSLNAGDAKMIEAITQKFFQAAKSSARKLL